MGEKNIPQEIPEKPTESQAALAGHTLATLAAPGRLRGNQGTARGFSYLFFLFFGLVKMVDFPNPGSFHIPQKFDIVHMCISFKYIRIIIYV